MDRTLHNANDRGAALVETAIASVLLLVLIAGILDYGMLFASGIDVSSAVRSAARSGAVTTALGPTDDYTIIHSAIQRPGKTRDDIDRIVVYQANSPQAGPPQQCETGTPPPGLKCNVYTPAQFSLSQDSLNAYTASQGWPPASRQPGTDYIGVWVEAKRQPYFKLIWSPSTYSESMALRIPPAPPPPAPGGPGWQAGSPGTMPYFTNDEFLCWPNRGCFQDESGGISGGNGGGSSG